MTATTSDHLPQFSFIPNILSNPSTQKSNFYERDWSKFKQEKFILDYFDKDWTDLLQIDQQNANLSMNSFLNNMNFILDTHAPLKKGNKYKLKFSKKSWNSIKNTWKGIKSIITIKDISADIPKSISVDGATISNPLAISNIFNNYFSSIADKTKLDISFSHKCFF